MTKILVYDRDPRFAATVKAAVDNMGYEGVIAADGYTVQPMALQHKPSLAILEYKIPEADGFEILVRLRKSDGLAGLPIIFASMTPKFEIEMVVLNETGIGYVDKPLDAMQLKLAIEGLIGKPAKTAPEPSSVGQIPPPGAPLGDPSAPAAFTGEPDLDGSRGDDVINLD